MNGAEDKEVSRVLGLVHGQVCYLQLPATDTARAAEFYEAVFGWQIERPYPSFEAPGLIGQWVDDRRPAPGAGPMIWLHVADMDETLDRVAEHGGQILEPPSPDGPTRVLATIADPAGNPIGLAGHQLPRNQGDQDPRLSSGRTTSWHAVFQRKGYTVIM